MKALALGAGCAAALGVVVAAAITADVTTSSPLRPDGAWETALVAAVVGGLAAYLVGLVVVSRRPPPTRAVVAIAIAMQLAPLVAPALLSTDVYTYWMYGRIGAVHDANPYVDPPSDFPQDPAFELMGASWHDTTSLYGPGFTLASEVVAAAVGDSGDAAAWAFKALAALGMVAIVLCAAALAARPSYAAAFVGWNPLLPLHFAGGGHNDAWMIALVLGGLLLSHRGRPQLAGGAWALSISVKWVPLVLLPLHWLARRRAGLPLGVRGFLLAGFVLAAVATARYGVDWFSAASGLSRQARSTGALGLAKLLGDAGLGHRAVLATLALGFACVYAVLLLQAFRGRARLGLAAGAFALAQGWLNPWYALWPVALSAVEEDRVARVLALVLTAYLLRDVVPV